MKIAVACERNIVSEHFGHCEGFDIYEVENKNILKKEYIQNPGHRPGYLPVFLKELNIDIIISGGMGSTAQELFRQNNIEVIVGTLGLSDEVVQKYINGEITSTGSICTEHAHERHCNGQINE
ncbi:NifB/NifX family molybdenum-iron cluster-binding protein [Paraclostridium sordellii]|uniref:NifB/NifX family molybdenum-iron cluster-binding protein n=1 Tax=Paraclostridium sordellii TaxID=1505 RepID=UPI0003866F38|nr:NifB/NifX family molybdenum-iron cluster-binding protein [Paeniclostridium sordellii]EPZ56066.1 dinitrogenase iron-molybdenum cofactor family protein [[Clostridium] sordellii VPI 9048] [Paeniclostridium sordellii VPI 9048]CEK38195.1 putative nitrogenase iron-molybdenum cofactorprotein [[Clostridium] sordellii] [Paeniclostridium sordellii]